MKFLSAIALTIMLAASSSFATDSTNVKDVKNAAKEEAASYEQFLKEVKEFEASPKFNPKLLTDELPLDLNYGDVKAPVKIVEYASLSCIHCKQFHKEVFYNLKKNYIDTGKVYFKYRHYPLNAPAVKGAIVLDCVAPETKASFIGALFEAQAEWAYTKSEADLKDKLSTVSKVAGLTDAQFETCYNDEAKQTTVLENMKRAYDELMITSTPGLFINGKRYLESREYEGIAKHIDGLIASGGAAKAAEPAMPKAETPAAAPAVPAKTEEKK